MKKSLFLWVAFLMLTASFASTTVSIKPRLKASEIMIPLGNNQTISLMDLSRISIKEVETLRGEKMKAFDRISFKAAQRQLKKTINPDGTLSNKFVKKFQKAEGTGFNLGGFALGFLLGLIGVLIAYLIKGDERKNRIKWAWIGFAVAVVLYIILLLA